MLAAAANEMGTGEFVVYLLVALGIIVLAVSTRMGLFDWFKKRTPKATATPTAVSTSAQLIEAWRRIVVGDSKSWVLFSHGTCVIIMQPKADLLAQAVELMREYGPVHVGSPAGDFGVITLTAHPG